MGCLRLTYQENGDANFFCGLWKKSATEKNCDNYYAFGLTFNSYQRENSVANRWKFQGQEHVDDLGLNWDSFKWRNHMPDIGRFFNVDPLADKYVHNSPYAFSENKVTAHIELEGLEAVSYLNKEIAGVENAVGQVVDGVKALPGVIGGALSNFGGAVANFFTSDNTQSSIGTVANVIDQVSTDNATGKTAAAIGTGLDAIQVGVKISNAATQGTPEATGDLVETIIEKTVTNTASAVSSGVGLAAGVIIDDAKKGSNATLNPQRLAGSYRLSAGQNYAAVARIQQINSSSSASSGSASSSSQTTTTTSTTTTSTGTARDKEYE